jgi:diguanylate cyclase (GGDEF)-like protein
MGAGGTRARRWRRRGVRALARYRADGAPPARTDAAFDALDRRMRLAIVLAFCGGALVYLLVALVAPDTVHGGRTFAFALVALGLVSGPGIAALPWRHHGRDLFALVFLHAAVLAAGLIYLTGGAASPFAPVFLLITVPAGLAVGTRLAVPVIAACATLGFLPLLYATPGPRFLVQQSALGACILASAAFNRLIVPELLRRARAEQSLRDDLRATRLLRDELARANARLAEQARTDALTGLPNHGAILAELDAACARQASTTAHFSILFLDLDRFKRINDTNGHQAGDAVLRHIAAIVGARAGRHGRAGRYGGEEFLIVLDDATAQEAARHAEALRIAVAQRPLALPDGTTIGATISVGVASAPAHGTDGEMLLRAADDALYRAKATGRDRVCVATAPYEGRRAASGGIERRAAARR